MGPDGSRALELIFTLRAFPSPFIKNLGRETRNKSIRTEGQVRSETDLVTGSRVSNL